jgi:hypothetical protein
VNDEEYGNRARAVEMAKMKLDMSAKYQQVFCGEHSLNELWGSSLETAKMVCKKKGEILELTQQSTSNRPPTIGKANFCICPARSLAKPLADHRSSW